MDYVNQCSCYRPMLFYSHYYYYISLQPLCLHLKHLPVSICHSVFITDRTSERYCNRLHPSVYLYLLVYLIIHLRAVKRLCVCACMCVSYKCKRFLPILCRVAFVENRLPEITSSVARLIPAYSFGCTSKPF